MIDSTSGARRRTARPRSARPSVPLPAASLARDWLVALAFATLVLVGSAWLTRELDAGGAFNQYNTLFDSDPNARIETFAHGWGPDGRSLQHPNLGLVTSFPVRVVVAAGARLGVVEREEPARRTLALLLAPLASALAAVVIFLLLRRLHLPRPASVLATLLGTVSFSQVVFGSIPDHFALSGLLLATGMFLVVATVQNGTVSRWNWIALTVAAAGITVTNGGLALLLLGVAAAGTRPGLRAAAADVAVVGGASAALVLALWAGATVAYATSPATPLAESSHWVGAYLRQDPGTTLLRFPATVANSVAAPHPRLLPDPLETGKTGRQQERFTLEPVPGGSWHVHPVGWCVLLLMAAGAARLWRGAGVGRAVCVAAFAILLYNALLHSVWGPEQFLYSQHWIATVPVLVSGLMFGSSRVAWAGIISCGALATAVAALSAERVMGILMALSSAP